MTRHRNRYWAHRTRVGGDNRDFMRESMNPDDPWIQPVVDEARGNLMLAAYKRRWRATVLQKRVKAFGFVSFVAQRKWMEGQRAK